MNKLSVLIPTHNKSNNEIMNILVTLNVSGHCIVANQINENSIHYDDNTIIINNNTKGVSVNRNILLENVDTDYCLFIDDDCVLMDNYEKVVIKEFNKHPDAEVIVFSRDSNDTMFLPVTLKERKAKSFRHISKMGAPGIAIKTQAIKKYNLRFNEKLGTPNYFYNGEDSLFLFELLRKKVSVYTSSIHLYLLLLGSNKSSYFTEYDEHFFASVGGVQYLLHSKTYKIYLIKQAIYYKNRTKLCFLQIFKSFHFGVKTMKNMVLSRVLSLNGN